MIEGMDQKSSVFEQGEITSEAFQALDSRVIKLWRLTDMIGFVVLLSVLLISLIPFAMKYPQVRLWLGGGWFGLAAICVWFSFWRPPRLFRSWGWRIDAKVLEIRSGLLFQRTRLLPLSRLQHVDLERGPLERRFGLASLILHTAGTHSANITIPGLNADEAVRLRDHLVEIGGDDAV